MKDFIISTPSLIRDIFSPRNLPWHLLAWALTYLLVVTHIDWKYFLAVRNEALNAFFRPALFGGFLIPVVLPLAFIMIGAITHAYRLKIYGFALMQGALLGWLVSSAYKAFTGRVQPNVHNLLVDGSAQFNFGFWEHGIFWGWPSSHTTTAFGMAMAAFVLIPKERYILRALTVIYSLYVGFGVSLSIHWFSDFVAGAIIGTVIGITVGNRYKKKLFLSS